MNAGGNGAAARVLDEAGIPHVTHCAIGHAAEEITNLAASLECDQIAMGTHGRNALADVLAGSTTRKVVHYATVPVLLVK